MPNTKDLQTILIADDIEANRVLLTEILGAEQYRIVQAQDGEEAMELLENGEVDLALLDVMMPGRTGFAVCRQEFAIADGAFLKRGRIRIEQDKLSFVVHGVVKKLEVIQEALAVLARLAKGIESAPITQ